MVNFSTRTVVSVGVALLIFLNATHFSSFNSSLDRIRRKLNLVSLMSENKYPLNMFRGIGEFPFDPTDKIMLWHVPRQGCASKRDILEQCLTNRTAITTGATKETTNTSSTAKIGAEEVDIIITENLFEAAMTFLSWEHRGRLITFIRDPVEREYAHFIELRNAQYEALPGDKNYDPVFKDMKLEGYVNSDYISSNWLTRNLLGLDNFHVLREKHLERAKIIMREKMLVLLVDEADESINHLLEKYYESSGKEFDSRLECIGRVIEDYSNKYIPTHTPMLPQYSHEYAMIAHHNNFDVQLYHHARYLFTEQHLQIDRKIEFLKIMEETER